MYLPDRVRACVFGVSLALLALSFALNRAQAAPMESGADILSKGLVSAIEKHYPGARIEISPSIRWTVGHAPEHVTGVNVLDESALGEVRIRVTGESADAQSADGGDVTATRAMHPETAEGYVGFQAFVTAWTMNRRVLPNEKLDPEAFSKVEVNVASGQYHDVRGLIIPVTTEEALTSYQSRQTLIEGGILLSSTIERIPDVRKGDAVRVNLTSGGLTLTVPGIAEEPAYLNGRIRVMTGQTKRELVGELAQGGIVEVKL